jgi:GDP-L-fucose synthase
MHLQMDNFFKDKKIVVTGGSGFIGSNFILELVKRGIHVTTHTHKSELQIITDNITVIPNIDLTKLEDCMKLLEGADYVIHCGGNIAHPSTVPTDIQISIQHLTIMGTLLDACVKSGVKKILDLNSSTGYPDIREPLNEDQFWVDEPYKSYFGYGWMRRYREKLLEHVSKFSGLEVGLARCTAIFGPYDNFNLKTCHVVPALIKRVLSGEDPLIVWGTPDVVRDFLYIKDVINGALLILEKGESMRPYNLGYGGGITIEEIVNAIVKVTGKDIEIKWDSSKPTTIPFRAVDTSRITNELGFKPEYTFEEGINETINWYKENLK